MNAFQTPLISFTCLLKKVDLVSSGKQGLFIIGNLRQAEGYSAEHIGGTMPDFAIVPMREAQASPISGRQGRFTQEYIRYIQQISQGQAGKLHLGEQENPVTIRRRLVLAAQALDIKLIKRSGKDMYFWRENGAEEQPRPRRGRRPRRQEETAEQYFSETGELDHGVPAEESPELGQRAQEAERRIEQS